jgi:hypothetical protein
MGTGNIIKIRNVDTVVLKFIIIIIIIIISLGNLSLYPVTHQQLRKAKKRINPSTSEGLAGIQHFIFKSCIYIYTSKGKGSPYNRPLRPRG